MKSPIILFFIISIITIDVSLGRPSTMRTPEEIKKFAEFLKAKTHGKPEAPLNTHLEKVQNAWERSGAFEGDIILTKEQRDALVAEYSGMKNSALSAVSLWPNNTMYYLIDDTHFNPEHINYIEKAIEVLRGVSCVKIKSKTSNVKDYVSIQGSGGGCQSKVGFAGIGPQTLNLKPSKVGTGCFKQGTIIHELLHSLGFYHMQSSYERDDFVAINWDKIKPGHEYNFNKYTSSQVTNLGVKYDYGSILHYSEYSFSTDGTKTIYPIQKTNITIGQRERMSDGDMIKLNKRYKCPGF